MGAVRRALCVGSATHGVHNCSDRRVCAGGVAVGMMLPNELIWVMEKLGFDWPDIDEDELRRGSGMVRVFHDDLESKIQAMDRKVNGDLAGAMRGQAGPAYVGAWNQNRSQNLEKLLDILGPVPTGIDIASDAVF